MMSLCTKHYEINWFRIVGVIVKLTKSPVFENGSTAAYIRRQTFS